MVEHARRWTGDVPWVKAQWGVDNALFHGSWDAAALRADLAIDKDAFVVFSPRQFGNKYNLDLIVEAIPEVLAAVPEAVFVFKHCIAQNDLDQRLPARVRELGVEDRVRFIGPSPTPEQSHRRVASLFALSDIFVSIPTWDGGTPVTLFEGMATGTLPIVSPIDTNLEYVRDGENGLVLPGLNRRALVDTILDSHRAAHWRRGLQDRLCEFAAEHCNYKREMERVERFYQNLAPSEPPARTAPSTFKPLPSSPSNSV